MDRDEIQRFVAIAISEVDDVLVALSRYESLGLEVSLARDFDYRKIGPNFVREKERIDVELLNALESLIKLARSWCRDEGVNEFLAALFRYLNEVPF